MRSFTKCASCDAGWSDGHWRLALLYVDLQNRTLRPWGRKAAQAELAAGLNDRNVLFSMEPGC